MYVYVLSFRGSIQSRQVYDNMMQPYNVSRILTPEVTLDMQAYNSYSPLFMSYVPILPLVVSEALHSRTFRTCFAISYGYVYPATT